MDHVFNITIKKFGNYEEPQAIDLRTDPPQAISERRSTGPHVTFIEPYLGDTKGD